MNVERILHDFAFKHGISYDDLIGKRKPAHFVAARDEVIRYMREKGASTPQIGRALGNRDHTTILHHCQKMGLDPVEKSS